MNTLSLVDELQKIRLSPPPGQSSEVAFLRYCKNTLSSVEGIHFDFKQKSDSTTSLPGNDDRANLAKAVSGFANGGGGVLIWGIADGTLDSKPIVDVDEFLEELLKLAHQTTDPTVPGIDGFTIPSASNDGSGFAIVHVPESSLPPHQVSLSGKYKGRYYIRSGSSFNTATHWQLEDMFGRRPRPLLSLTHRFEPAHKTEQFDYLSLFLQIRNEGRGVARFVFISIQKTDDLDLKKQPPEGEILRFIPGSKDNEMRWGGFEGPVIHSGMAIDVTRAAIGISTKENPRESIHSLEIPYVIAADGCKPVEGVLSLSAEDVWAAYEAVFLSRS